MSRFMDPKHANLEPYTPGEQPAERNLIKLNTNENPYPPSPKAAEAVADAMARGLQRYNDPTAKDLVRAIAGYYGLDEDQVITSNGSDEILAFSFLAFCGEKGVVFPEISYGFYPVFASLFGICARQAPLRDDFTIDIRDYLNPGENVVIANPNAPTGLYLPLDAIEEILRAHPDDVVLIDEAYVDFGAKSAVTLLDRYENLLVVQTFSKSRSLAGGRIGFAMGSKTLIGDLSTVRFSFNPYNVGTLAQRAATAAMEDVEYFQECTSRIIATRGRTASALRDMGCTLTDSMTNFLFVRLPNVSGETAQRRLREMGILVRRFGQPRIEDYLRVSIGSEEDMQVFIEAVRQIIREAKA